MKITIVGGGSYSWTHTLFQNFVLNPFFEGSTICLMDINKTALDRVGRVCSNFNGKPGLLVVETTTNMKKALQGASYVVVAISQGGLQPELEDHRIARRYGFYNLKGSEVGVAGCSRTLRHVPEVVRIARQMEKHCPRAMLLNVTNPLTTITRAVNKYTSIKSVGFCHGVVNHLEAIVPLFSDDCEARGLDGVDFNVAGVDHFSWQLSIKYHGRDALEIMRKKGFIEAARRGKTLVTYDDSFAGRENQRLRFLIWDIIGYLPALSDEHCVEFFGQLMKSPEVRDHYGVAYDRIKERRETVKEAAQMARKMQRDKNAVPVRNNECIDRFIAALNGGGTLIDVLNHPNEGQIPNLPLDSVVETKCLVDATGVHPIHAGALPPILESLVRPVAIREELYMEAAMEADPRKLRAALSTDPLVNDFRRIHELSEELLAYNRKFGDMK